MAPMSVRYSRVQSDSARLKFGAFVSLLRYFYHTSSSESKVLSTFSPNQFCLATQYTIFTPLASPESAALWRSVNGRISGFHSEGHNTISEPLRPFARTPLSWRRGFYDFCWTSATVMETYYSYSIS